MNLLIGLLAGLNDKEPTALLLLDPDPAPCQPEVRGRLRGPDTTYTCGVPATRSWCSHVSKGHRGSSQGLSKLPQGHQAAATRTLGPHLKTATGAAHGSTPSLPPGLPGDSTPRVASTGGPPASWPLTIQKGRCFSCPRPPVPSSDKAATPTSQSSPGLGQKEPGGWWEGEGTPDSGLSVWQRKG